MVKMTERNGQLGQSAVEYMMLLAAIALAVFGTFQLLGIDSKRPFCDVLSGLGIQPVEQCQHDETNFQFADRFDQGLAKWRLVKGRQWQINTIQGRLCVDSLSEHWAFANGSSGQNYIIETTVLMETQGSYGIFFRSSGSSKVNGYTFQYTPAGERPRFTFHKWVNGYRIWPPLAESAVNGPAGHYDRSHAVTLIIQNDVFTAVIDGEVVLVSQDNSYTSGELGLWVAANSQLCFENVMATAP